MNINLNQLFHPKNLFTIFIFLLSTICPGILILYFYKNSLFVTLDTLKLILLSLSITLPLSTLFAIFIFLALIGLSIAKEGFFKYDDSPFSIDGALFTAFINGSLISSLTLYLLLAVHLIVNLPIKMFVIVLVIIGIIIVGISFYLNVTISFKIIKNERSKHMSPPAVITTVAPARNEDEGDGSAC